MKYNIFNYNQKAAIDNKLDLKDLLIMSWIQDFFHSDSIVKKIIDNKEYGWIKYDYMMQQIPIIEISSTSGLYKRMKILSEKNFLEHKVIANKKGTFSFYRIGSKTYELITSNTSKSHSPQNQTPVSTKSDPLSPEKEEQKILLSNDSSIKIESTAKNVVVQKQEEYLFLPEWQELSEYETEKTLWYITQRKEDHGKTIKNTSKAIKPILLAILELKAKGLSIDDIMENIKDKNGCVYQTIRIGYFDNVFSRLKAQNNTNSYKNGNSYQQTETYTPKQPLNDDKNSKDYFSYRFNEDISVAFGYQECIELTNSIIEQKPEFEKVARTKALLEWLRTETKSQYNTKIKLEVLDIYKKGGYDVFVSKAIQENPNSPWKSLLDLLNN